MYDEDLANLEECLRRLKIEYHIFFTGNRKKPPDDLRLRVEKLVKKLSECSDLSSSQRFRYNTLITRFYVHRDLWRRTMLEREMGNDIRPERTPQEPASRPVESVRISISDAAADETEVKALYDALLRIKGDSGETPLSYDQFARYIANKTRSIREKHGCASVAFTLAVDENAIRFTAAAESR